MKILKEKRCIAMTCILACVLVLVGFFFSGSIQSEAEQPEIIDGELVILIDDSGSVSAFREAINQWAERVGFFAQDTGIKVTVKSFDDIGNINQLFNGRISSSAGTGKEGSGRLDEYLSALKKMKYDKAYTDQKGAFAQSVSFMETSRAKWKCIVMLSDAKLDYRTDSDEKAAKDQFVEDVKAFAQGKNQEVILVGFGNDTGLFEACEGANVLFGGSETDLLEDALSKVFTGLGYRNESIPVTVEKNQMKFTLNRDVFRLVLVLKSSGNIEKSVLDTLIVERADGKTIKEYSSSLAGNSCILYFPDAQKGNYIVTLPGRDWKCYVAAQDKIMVYDVNLFVTPNEGIDSGEEGISIYTIRQENFILEAKIKTTPNDDNIYLNAQYCIMPVGQGEQISQKDSNDKYTYKEFARYSSESSGFRQEINLRTNQGIDQAASSDVLNGQYICQVVVNQGKIGSFESEPIILKVEIPVSTSTPTSQPDPKKILKYVGDTIDIREEWNLPKDTGDCYITLDGEKVFEIDGEGSSKGCTYKDEKLTFKEVKSYTVGIVTAQDETIGNDICYEVRKKPSCWESFFNWLRDKGWWS